MHEAHLKDSIDILKGLIDFFHPLSASQNNLAGNEDEQDQLWLPHAEHQPWEHLRLVVTEDVELRCQALQADREVDGAGRHHVLDGELGKGDSIAELL